MEKCKISVIVPIGAGTEDIRPCMDSLISQADPAVQILAVFFENNLLASFKDAFAPYPSVCVVNGAGRLNDKRWLNELLFSVEGEYVTIFPPQRLAGKEMLTCLGKAVAEDKPEVVLAGIVTAKGERPVASCVTHNRLFCPRTDWLCALERVAFFSINPLAVTALFKKTYLKELTVRFGDRLCMLHPGADMAACVWYAAQRVRLLADCPAVMTGWEDVAERDTEKLFCFEKAAEEKDIMLAAIMVRLQYDAFFARISACRTDEEGMRDSQKMRSVICQHMEMGRLQEMYFTAAQWQAVQVLLKDPFLYWQKVRNKEISLPYVPVSASEEKDNGRKSQLWKLTSLCIGAVKCFREHGLAYTFWNVADKLCRRESI